MKDKEQIILDIGCGQKKMEGAIGIDFSPFFYGRYYFRFE